MGYENEKIRPTYICFNDEAGNWNNSKDLFYVRVTVIVNSIHVKNIEQTISEIRNNYGLVKLDCEIKWQDLWLLRQCFKNNNDKIKDKRINKIYSFLNEKNSDYHLLINYCSDMLSLLNNYDSEIIATFSSDHIRNKEENILKFHIQDHLQRIQMQCDGSIIFIIYDSLDDSKQKMLKEIHKSLVIKSDYVEYNSISETLLFDYSYDNKLLQLADFVAGTIRNTLVAIDKNSTNNYMKSVEFFENYIYPNLARNSNGDYWGVGLKETPKKDSYREKMKQRIQAIFLDKR